MACAKLVIFTRLKLLIHKNITSVRWSVGWIFVILPCNMYDMAGATALAAKP
jgi:hypothetical protein